MTLQKRIISKAAGAVSQAVGGVLGRVSDVHDVHDVKDVGKCAIMREKR